MRLVIAVAIILMSMTLSTAQAAGSPHTIGVGVGYGKLDFESKSKNSYDDGDGVVWDLWYRYQLTEHWGAELGYLDGDSGLIDAILDGISDIHDLRYKGARASIYGVYPLYKHGGLYAKVGYGVFDVKYTFNKQNQSDNDNGFVGALGFEHRFTSGFGLNVEYLYIPLDHITVQSAILGMSWRF